MIKKIEIQEITQEALDKQVAGVTVGLVAGFVTLVVLNVMNTLVETAGIEEIEITNITKES